MDGVGGDMKIDLYTKAVLTAIAVGLFWVAVNMTIPAAAGPDIVAVDIQRIDGQRIHRTALPVVVKE